MSKQSKAPMPAHSFKRHPFVMGALALGIAAAIGLLWAYYWRVFFYLDDRFPAWGTTGGCIGFCLVVAAAAFLVRRLRNLSVRAAVCIFLCGILFAFANPPLQTPDESDHYLRTYAISLGRFDFDYNRTYPDDVASLLDAFPGACVNAHTSVGIGTDPDTGADKPYDTAGYAL